MLQSGPDAVKLFSALKTYGYGASPMPLPLLRQALDRPFAVPMVRTVHGVGFRLEADA